MSGLLGQFNRRQFLTLLSAGTCSCVLGAPSLDFGGGNSDDSLSGVSVAFWNGGFVPSRRLFSGDVSLSRGARIALHALIPDGNSKLEKLDVTVCFEPFHSAEFTAIAFDRDNNSQVLATRDFAVPIDPKHGLRLQLRWVDSKGSHAELLRFVPGREVGALKLRKGTTAIAPAAGSSLPDLRWAEYQQGDPELGTSDELLDVASPEGKSFKHAAILLEVMDG
ncbi:hypothetical protein KQI84_08005 [bacterium]|nr:hypothetical protein [bacterium]